MIDYETVSFQLAFAPQTLLKVGTIIEINGCPVQLMGDVIVKGYLQTEETPH